MYIYRERERERDCVAGDIGIGYYELFTDLVFAMRIGIGIGSTSIYRLLLSATYSSIRMYENTYIHTYTHTYIHTYYYSDTYIYIYI